MVGYVSSVKSQEYVIEGTETLCVPWWWVPWVFKHDKFDGFIEDWSRSISFSLDTSRASRHRRLSITNQSRMIGSTTTIARRRHRPNLGTNPPRLFTRWVNSRADFRSPAEQRIASVKDYKASAIALIARLAPCIVGRHTTYNSISDSKNSSAIVD